ncbi:MAG: formyltransferase family protein [Paraglaciecola sp.]|uniref:methionyl-tRNA formyltransferase n=1 Tax=Paraglaciecola sp. TaxID=1920173 RepID=UPI0032971B88
MKIAYFGYDPLSCCLEVFLRKGYQFAAIYCGESGPFTEKIIAFATKHHIKLCFDKPNLEQVRDLTAQGVELFFSAEYPWKIPIPSDLKYAINVHPTLLPEGRGMTPLPHLILNQSKHAGITLHKLTQNFDSGDILIQQAISIDPQECFDTLSAKIFRHTPKLLETLLDDLQGFYQNSQKQGEGSYWASITQAQQSIDWQQPTDQILLRLRAFGSLGTYAEIAGKIYIVTSAQARTYQHNYCAGEVVVENEHYLTIATIDGELCIPKSKIRISSII